MFSIFDRFRRKRADEEEYEEEYLEQEKAEEIGGEPEVHEERRPTEALLQDLWENRKEHPGDMKVVEFFLPALRERLDTHEIKRQAAEVMAKQTLDEEAMRDSGGKTLEVKPADAKCNVYIPSDRMTAFVCVFPPIADGEEITSGGIMEALETNKVTFGIDREKIDAIAAGREYGVLFAIARGVRQVDGEDGAVVDHYSREQDVGLKEDERGKVDHKSLHRFKSVAEGEVICEIIPPTQGENGIDVTGKELKAKNGRAPKVPQGKNTVLSEEGTKLTAGMDGDISFYNGAFHVERLLTIQESVDISVGNLDYNGNILIQEDVMAGFTVRATGNIVVRGTVSGGTLHAGGNIEIAKGVNGGTLEADGDIKLSFMENTHVTCKQDVKAATIINSDITCGGSVIVKDGKGILIGGSVTAGKSVEAKRIGNQSGCENTIKIGHALQADDNLDYLRKELKAKKAKLDEVQKNINYLKGKSSLSPEKQALVEKLQIQSMVHVEEIEGIAEKLEKLENERPDFSECRVYSETIYPMTNISLEYAKLTIRDTTARCMVYYQDGELLMGTF